MRLPWLPRIVKNARGRLQGARRAGGGEERTVAGERQDGPLGTPSWQDLSVISYRAEGYGAQGCRRGVRTLLPGLFRPLWLPAEPQTG